MYRQCSVKVTIADDNSLDQREVDRAVVFNQTLDKKSFNAVYRVNSGDAETQIQFPTLTTPYYLCILSDYPVKVRLNGVNATQFTLVSNNVPTVNVGAPLPDMCCMMLTGLITSIYLAPIAAAVQVANVKIILTGDPVNAYT